MPDTQAEILDELRGIRNELRVILAADEHAVVLCNTIVTGDKTSVMQLTHLAAEITRSLMISILTDNRSFNCAYA